MQLDFEFEASNNDEYKLDGIWNKAVYTKKSIIDQLPRLYYLILCKSYLEEENTWEPALTIQYFWKFTIAYHKNNPKKPTATFLLIHTALSMARPTTAPIKKRSQLIKFTTITTIKQAKKS